MRDRVARLRRWLAGGVFLLLAVIAAFIGYGRYVSHLRHLKLPLPPGVNIVREGGGWTYSRAVGSKTLYTIHAANFEQGKNGKTALHDVSVILYGKKDDRRDRLYGEDFEYDEKGGVLRALGQVHIDLQGAAAEQLDGKNAPQLKPGDLSDDTNSPNVMHVTTSGLVYLEKLGIAATSEDVDVQSGQMKGHARGADYSSDSGMLLLHSAVRMSGTAGGRPVRLIAGEAQFDQQAQQAHLTNAVYESDGRSVSAQHADLHRRSNGMLDKVDANGNVVLAAADGKATASHAELQMNAAGNPASALLTGGVVYASDQPLRQIRSQAGEARLTFTASKALEPDHALFLGTVHVTEKTRGAGSAAQWNTRDLDGAKVEVWFAAGADGKQALRNTEASGNAKLVMVDAPDASRQKAGARTEIAADDLKATMSQSGASVALDEITGQGHTSLVQSGSDGAEQTSQGDTLQAKFRAASGSGQQRPKAGDITASQNLMSAVQQGHVVITRRQPAKAGAQKAQDAQRALADRASYDGVKDQLLLTGAVRMSDAAGVMWAQQVTMDRASGDAHAIGAVKVDYTQSSGQEPMHIVAEHADLHNASSSATFFGSPVRVWQNGNQVQAPEVEIDRENRQMIARGTGTANSSLVRTMLVSAAGSQAGGTSAAAGPAPCATTRAVQTGGSAGQASSPGAVRIVSAGLVYSGNSQQVEFSGGVRADTADASVKAAQAIAYLARTGASAATASLEGGLDRMTASGHVELSRAQSHASGDQLVYDAARRSFVLSGGAHEPARAVDARGTSTAAAFRFTACDDTLEALGEASGAMGQRVETESAAGTARKGEKAAR